MKKLLFIVVFLFSSGMLLSQQSEVEISKDDVLILGEPSGAKYQNIDFPRKNTIIKRGAIADFRSLVGKTLIVHDIETDKNGKKVAILKRKDGLNFFRFFPKVKADIAEAIESEELKTVRPTG